MDYGIEAAQVFNKHAAAYEQKWMDQGKYQPEFDLFAHCLPKSGRVLELACGPGNASKAILDALPDLNWYGIDLAPEMVELAKKNNPRANFAVMDIRNIGALAPPYNGILGAFCLPYLNKEAVNQLFAHCAHLLSPGGIIYFSTMEDPYASSGYEYASNGIDRVLMHYYEYHDLHYLLQINGLEVFYACKLPYQKRDGSPGKELVLLARKAI